MSEVQYTYPLDPDGIKSENVIEKETATLTAANGRDFNFLIPAYAPFYVDSGNKFEIRKRGAAQPLKEGVDFYFGWSFQTANLTTGKLVYGAIVFNDQNAAGTYEITYHTIGGNLVLDEPTILQLLTNTIIDPRQTHWENISNKPTEFPSSPHIHNYDDMVGQAEVVAMLDRIRLTIVGANGKYYNSLLEHVNDHQNPHQITLEQLGLDDLGNMTAATQQEAETGVGLVHYMPATRVTQWAAVNIIPLIDAHKLDHQNPHQTTKEQVGMGMVVNAPFATMEQALEGAATNLYMAPDTSAAVAEWIAGEILQFHLDDWENPHRVTSAQVGLGNVSNFPIATIPEALSGTVERYLDSAGSRAITLDLLSFLSGNRGDALFYKTTNTGQSVEGDAILGFKSIVLNDDDLTNANATVVTAAQSLPSLMPYGSEANWVADSVDQNTMHCSMDVEGETILVDTVNYNKESANFEVSISSSSPQDGVLGMIIASGYINNQRVYLLAFRSAGDQGRKLWGLATYNLDDQTFDVIKETNGGLRWPDGMIDDSRVPDPEVENQYGKWSDYAGEIYIKASFVDNILTLNTTQPASYTNVATATMVINMEDAGITNITEFSSATFGVYASHQISSKFTINRRPGGRMPVIDTRTKTVSLWNGNTWESTDTDEYLSHIHPGRFYFSQFNSSLFFAGRDLSLVRIYREIPNLESRLAALEASIAP